MGEVIPFQQSPRWTLEEGLELIRTIQTKALHKGYHLALGGGVLNRGWSLNDLDIIALPMDGKHPVKPWVLANILQPYLGTPKDPNVGGPSVNGNRVFSFNTADGRKVDLLLGDAGSTGASGVKAYVWIVVGVMSVLFVAPLLGMAFIAWVDVLGRFFFGA